MARKPLTLLAGALALALFGAGLVHLFALRFQRGDTYPPYSTLRADPLGARALYESLQRCRGLRVERLYEPLRDGRLPPDTALFFVGDTIASNETIAVETTRTLDRFMRAGGRLVVLFRPQTIPAAPAARQPVAAATPAPCTNAPGTEAEQEQEEGDAGAREPAGADDKDAAAPKRVAKGKHARNREYG